MCHRSSYSLVSLAVPRLRLLLLPLSENALHLAAQLHETLHGTGRHVQDFFKQRGHGDQKFQHVGEPLASEGVAMIAGGQFVDTFAEHAKSWIDLTAFSFL